MFTIRNLRGLRQPLFKQDRKICLLRTVKPASLALEIVTVQPIGGVRGLKNTPPQDRTIEPRSWGQKQVRRGILNPTRKDDLGH